MNDYNIEIIPNIKKNYICRICGRKRTITYTKKCDAGGLLSNHGEQCLPVMKCPRCNNISMEEENDLC